VSFGALNSHLAKVLANPRTPADWQHIAFLTRARDSARLNYLNHVARSAKRTVFP
jgi:hypothetical protein